MCVMETVTAFTLCKKLAAAWASRRGGVATLTQSSGPPLIGPVAPFTLQLCGSLKVEAWQRFFRSCSCFLFIYFQATGGACSSAVMVLQLLLLRVAAGETAAC